MARARSSSPTPVEDTGPLIPEPVAPARPAAELAPTQLELPKSGGEPTPQPETTQSPSHSGSWQEPEYRYERKYTARGSLSEALAIVRHNPAHFREVYSPRSIQNIYLDTIDRTAFHTNVIGLDRRGKTRLRWYGDLFGTPKKLTLERKRRVSAVGTKESHLLQPFPIEPGFSLNSIRQAIDASDLPPAAREHLAHHELALLNRYQRRYFVSRDGKYRVTVDTDLEFWRLGQWENSLAAHVHDREAIVVELKYASDLDDDADRISRHFPFRLSRNSKYVAGLLATSSGLTV